MDAAYDLRDVVEHALRREVMAWRTYERLSERAEDGAGLNLLLQLSGYELDHVRQFTEVLRPQLDAAGIDPDAVVAEAEAAPLDLAGLVDEERLAKAEMPGLLEAALSFEAKMARTYREAAARESDAVVRGVFERLAGEEESHHRYVSDLIAALAMDPGDEPDEFPSH